MKDKYTDTENYKIGYNIGQLTRKKELFKCSSLFIRYQREGYNDGYAGRRYRYRPVPKYGGN